jgi:hypothetical protein
VVDWSDPLTFWLNLLHSGLGLITVVGVVAFAWAIYGDLRDRVASKGG